MSPYTSNASDSHTVLHTLWIWVQGQGANLVALTTSDPWVGFLKFRWLDILEFACLHAGGSGLTEKITRN
jgi:hypothetical protein